QQRSIRAARRFQHAKYQHGARIADRDLDLRQPAAYRKRIDQLAQRGDERAYGRGKHVATGHLRNVAAVTLVEPDQRPALLRHVTHRQSRAVAIAPRRTVYRRQDLLRMQPADMPQIAFEDTLLGGHLVAQIEVLQGATSALSEKRTTRHRARGARLVHRRQGGDFVAGLLAMREGAHDLARQGALDEDGLAVAARDSAPFLIQGFDDEFLQAIPLRRSPSAPRTR